MLDTVLGGFHFTLKWLISGTLVPHISWIRKLMLEQVKKCGQDHPAHDSNPEKNLTPEAALLMTPSCFVR